MAHKPSFMRHLSVSSVPNFGKTLQSPQSDLTPWTLTLFLKHGNITLFRKLLQVSEAVDLNWILFTFLTTKELEFNAYLFIFKQADFNIHTYWIILLVNHGILLPKLF